MNGVEPYLHPRGANASAIASIRPRIRVGVFLDPPPIPRDRAAHAATSVSPVFTPTPGIGSIPPRSLPAGVSLRPETGVPEGFDR